jgi:catechol 2,3-dioxygenase-like lactoylglutathione lyase family enzyme
VRDLHLTQVATVVIPVSDQDRALAFYTETLGLQKVSDFTYETGERWLEVAPPGAGTRLSLVRAREERPAGIETGVALNSSDPLADHAALRAAGVDVDPEPLPEGRVVWWAGAPLSGFPTQFRVRDLDGNVLLIVRHP